MQTASSAHQTGSIDAGSEADVLTFATLMAMSFGSPSAGAALS